MHRRHLAATFVTLAMVVGACGSGTADDAETTPAPTASATTSTPTPSAAPTTPEPTASPGPTVPPPTTPAPSATPTVPSEPPATQPPPGPEAEPTPPGTSLPGEPIDFGPRAGDVLGVIGVQHDDRLNLRAAPGTDQEILARLAPTEDDLVAQGHARMLPRSLWYEVEAAGTVGWVGAKYVSRLGLVDDITSRVVSQLGMRPTADSMEELGAIVADSQAPEEQPGLFIRMVVAPDESGDLGEVTYDVVGIGDDSVRGVRLHVFGTPVAHGFSLKSVEQTLFCDRGVTEDGLCV